MIKSHLASSLRIHVYASGESYRCGRTYASGRLFLSNAKVTSVEMDSHFLAINYSYRLPVLWFARFNDKRLLSLQRDIAVVPCVIMKLGLRGLKKLGCAGTKLELPGIAPSYRLT